MEKLVRPFYPQLHVAAFDGLHFATFRFDEQPTFRIESPGNPEDRTDPHWLVAKKVTGAEVGEE